MFILPALSFGKLAKIVISKNNSSLPSRDKPLERNKYLKFEQASRKFKLETRNTQENGLIKPEGNLSDLNT